MWDPSPTTSFAFSKIAWIPDTRDFLSLRSGVRRPQDADLDHPHRMQAVEHGVAERA